MLLLLSFTSLSELVKNKKKKATSSVNREEERRGEEERRRVVMCERVELRRLCLLK